MNSLLQGEAVTRGFLGRILVKATPVFGVTKSIRKSYIS